MSVEGPNVCPPSADTATAASSSPPRVLSSHPTTTTPNGPSAGPGESENAQDGPCERLTGALHERPPSADWTYSASCLCTVRSLRLSKETWTFPVGPTLIEAQWAWIGALEMLRGIEKVWPASVERLKT